MMAQKCRESFAKAGLLDNKVLSNLGCLGDRVWLRLGRLAEKIGMLYVLL